MFTLTNPVGANSQNNPSDVSKVISHLNIRKTQSALRHSLSSMIIPNVGESDLHEKLTSAIKLFQKKIQKNNSPDGIVSPLGDTVLFLGGVRTLGKVIIVDIDDQNLYAYENGVLKFSFFSASGDKGHPTAIWPSLHKIFRRHEIYRSRAYDAQMNYAMFFTHDGKAIHQSNAVSITSILKDWGINSVGSHGCVRLAEENAKTLFNWTPMHTPVFIDLEKP
jgi:lipoprotein-anchoring transpeptidase ErfK/SrfK